MSASVRSLPSLPVLELELPVLPVLPAVSVRVPNSARGSGRRRRGSDLSHPFGSGAVLSVLASVSFICAVILSMWCSVVVVAVVLAVVTGASCSVAVAVVVVACLARLRLTATRLAHRSMSPLPGCVVQRVVVRPSL